MFSYENAYSTDETKHRTNFWFKRTSEGSENNFGCKWSMEIIAELL